MNEYPNALSCRQNKYPSIPVIVVTGITDLEVRASFMGQGVSDNLVKPVDARTFIASVGHAIEQ